MPFDTDLYVETRFTLPDAHRAALAFFQAPEDADAAFCMSDTVALGVIRALRDLGMSVPGDVSVIGIDGMEMGQYTVPRLSTVVQPLGEIAQKSVQVLGDLMENGAPAKHVTVQGMLRLTESVRAE